MKKKRAAFFTLAPLVLVECLVILIIILFIVGISATIVVPQLYMSRKLDKLSQETESFPVYTLSEVLHLDGREFPHDKWLTDNGVDGYVEEVLAVDATSIWFVYRNPEQTDQGWIWNIATVDLDGNNFQIRHSEEFGLNGGETHYHCYNNYREGFLEKKNGFYHNGKIVLTDHVKLIEYDMQTDEVQEMSTDQYVYPDERMEVTIENHRQIQIVCEDQQRIITPDSMSQSSEAFASIMELDKKTIWSGVSPLDELYHCVQTDGENAYIICSIMHWGGEVYGTVFQYDFQTDTYAYSFYEYISDSIDYDFYVIPRIE